MSAENVSVVRELFQAAEQSGDPKAILDFLDPAMVWQVRADLPDDADAHVGDEGAQRLFKALEEVMREGQHQPREFIEAGDAVVVPLRLAGHGRSGSGADVVDLGETWVFELRDGKVTQVREYASKTKALQAAGLQE